jgi:peptidoglycan biosynthesis protein MviN/MurJ (putative lipid II flippase)
MGIQGLALAFSLAAILNLFLLLTLLHYRLGDFDDAVVVVSLFKITVAALLGGMVLQLLKAPVASLVDMDRGWGIFMQLVVTFGAGSLTYLLMCMLLKCDELAAIRRYLPTKRDRLSPGVETPRFEGMVD